MKRYFLAAIAVIVSLSVSAQDLVRFNYNKNGKIYTGTERIRVEAPTSKDDAVELKLTRIIFPDGGIVWKLRAEFEEPTPWKMPKNAPMTINTTAGKVVVLKNSADSPNLVAPEGLTSGGRKVYWNYGEYYLEDPDLRKLLAGVSAIDVQKRWSSDGYIKVNYAADQFGEALRKAHRAITDAPAPAFELGSHLKSLQDQKGSRLAETQTLQITSSLSASLVSLYYAASNSDSYDLNLYLPGKTIPLGSAITIVTSGGEAIELQQEKDLVAGRVICYPTADELKSMIRGVASVSVQTTDGPATFSFSDKSFANAIYRLYNSLQTVSIL